MPLLQLDQLAISLGGIIALAGVDLQVEDGEILSVIGPNGSGKTTMFNCISGVYHPDQGHPSSVVDASFGLTHWRGNRG